MIHQDLLDEVYAVACQVSGLPKMDKDTLRRYPQLGEAIIVAYSNMRAARIMISEEPPIVVVPDEEPEPEPEAPVEPPPPPEPEEVMIGADGESITVDDGASDD